MISCIIPVYNGEQWLAEVIESVLNQRYLKSDVNDSKEIIVIDDGSTDNSLEIARKYPVKVISQVNKGLASARNTGIMNARGSWILPLDCDDILLPNCLEKIIEKSTENFNYDVIGLSFKCFGLNEQEVILMPEPKIEDFKTANRLGYCSAIETSALLEVGGYSPKMVEGYEDLHLWINLLSRGKKIVTIPEVLWMYRTKQESMYTKITPEIHKKLIAQINKDFPQAKLEF